jgi:hypothetical protein
MSSKRSLFHFTRRRSRPSEDRGRNARNETEDKKIARLRANPDPDEIRDHLMTCMGRGNFLIANYFLWEYMSGDERGKFMLLCSRRPKDVFAVEEYGKWYEEFVSEWYNFWNNGSGGVL